TITVDLAEFRPQEKVELMNEKSVVVTTNYLKLSNQLKKAQDSLQKVEATIVGRMAKLKAKDRE
ncbi:hypothetical protein KI387_024046, partial [Taxus chinensis]